MTCKYKTSEGWCDCYDCPSYHDRCGWLTNDCPNREPIPRLNAPCKDCPERVPGCHSSCEKYLTFTDQRQRAKEYLRQIADEEQTAHDAKRKYRMQWTKKKLKKG